ncbi:MAG: nitroreductase [Bacteroidota bacterium]|nr:nitroreductase [Bacteroidota bacterium]
MEKNINHIIKERRSIFPKEYTGEILPDEVLNTLLENANFAPNHHSNYPWRFVIINPNKIKVWLDKAAEIYQSNTSKELFKEDKFNKILGFSQLISHVIAIVMVREDSKTKELEDVEAVACAVQNMYLSLSQFENAGGYWSTGLGTYDSEMKSFLRLNENETLLGYFILGHVAEKRMLGGRRNYQNFVREL